MSREIDERIVQMEFENAQFERNARQSMSTLDKLKNGFNFSKATDSAYELNDAIDGMDLSVLGNAVMSVQQKFSALEVIGVTALMRITNQVMATGERLVKSLSIDQVTAGWSKYEQKTRSVQTIMNATGRSIDEVNGYLDKLMWFSDETSYGFTDMTAALAQMTSSGGKVENLIPLITGVANATAYAGKGASEFSRIMYNLNQSYGAGSLQYMDWRSIELAGAGSEQLKQIFIDTGVELGKINKGAVTVANFSQTLSKKWATTEVIEKAFGKFAELSTAAYEAVQRGEFDTASEAIEALADKYDTLAVKAFKSAQEAKSFSEAIDATKDAVSSGWLKTFEILFGNYEEAKELWTDLANGLWDVFAAGAETRNAILQIWKDRGGRDQLITAFWNIWDAVSSISSTFKEGLNRDITKFFNYKRLGLWSSSLKEGTRAFKRYVDRLKENETVMDNLATIGKGFQSILSLIGRAAHFVGESFKNIFVALAPLGEGISNIIAGFAALITNFKESTDHEWQIADRTNKLTNTLKPLFDLISKLVTGFNKRTAAFRDFAQGADIFNKSTDGVSEKVSVLEIVSGVFKGIADTLGQVLPVFGKIGSIFGKIFGIVADGVEKFLDVVDRAVTNGNWNSLLSIFTGSAIYIAISRLKDVFDGFSDTVTWFSDGVFDAFQGMRRAFAGIKVKQIIQIAGAMLVLAIAMKLFASIDGDGLTNAIAGIGTIFAALALYSAFMKEIMTGFDPKRVKNLDKINGSLIKLSVAVLILSIAVKNLSKLSWEEIGKGLVAVGGLMIMIAMAVKKMSPLASGDFENRTLKASGLILSLSVSMLILAKAVKQFGAMSLPEIGKGLLAIGVLLIGIAAFVKFVSGANFGASMGIGILALGAGLLLIAKTIKTLGQDLEPAALEQGISALILVLFAIAGVIFVIGKADKVLAGGVAIVAIAAALLILSRALKVMSTISNEQMGVALTGLAVGLARMVGAVMLAKGSLGGARAMLIMSVALVALAGALILFSSIPLEKLGAGLLGMASALAVVAIGGWLIGLAAPQILFGALALAAMGLAAIVVAGAVIALGLAIKSVFSLISSAAEAIGGIGTAVVGVLDKVFSSESYDLESNGYDFTASITEGMEDGKPLFEDKATELSESGIDAIAMAQPEYVDVGAFLAQGGIDGLNSKADEIYATSYNLGQLSAQGFADGGGVRSPSRLTRASGRFLVEGGILGMEDLADKLYKTATGVGRRAADGISTMTQHIKDLIESDMDTNPVIRPVLDTTDIQNGMRGLDTTLGSKTAFKTGVSINGSMAEKANDAMSKAGQSQVTNINFTQNNTSPKALSRYDIYRQTNNQLNTIRGLVRST